MNLQVQSKSSQLLEALVTLGAVETLLLSMDLGRTGGEEGEGM